MAREAGPVSQALGQALLWLGQGCPQAAGRVGSQGTRWAAALVLGHPPLGQHRGSQLPCLEAAEGRPAAPDGPLWEGDYLSTLLTACSTILQRSPVLGGWLSRARSVGRLQ